MSKTVLDRWSIKETYLKLKDRPFGLALFSRAIGWIIPYSGTIYARVVKLESGYALVCMRDRRSVRNHLKSVHAVALMNLGELATGLALHYDLPQTSRAILTHLAMEYPKKARGTLRVEAKCMPPSANERQECVIIANIYDEKDTIVAKATATWLVGPKS